MALASMSLEWPQELNQSGGFFTKSRSQWSRSANTRIGFIGSFWRRGRLARRIWSDLAPMTSGAFARSASRRSARGCTGRTPRLMETRVSHFFAYLSRMRFIRRWGLMHNTYPENIQEHTLRVAMIAHALGVIRNRLFQGHANPERAAALALFHDASEVLTGDLPTPVKYFNPDIRIAYHSIETVANRKLLDMVPVELQE